MNPACLSGLLFLVFTLQACDSSERDTGNLTSISGPTMGTRYQVKIADPAATDHRDELRTSVEQILVDMNNSMSTYIGDSELSLINQNRTMQWLRTSEHLFTVLQEADRVSQLSQGAFDVTVGPLVDLWGFGAGSDSNARIPDENQIAEAIAGIGFRNIELDESNSRVRKRIALLEIDLSAIAKGYAVDVIAAALTGAGYQNFMVEIGGEVITRGQRSDHRGWRIGIEKPDIHTRAVQRVLELKDIAMATSGDYRNFIEVDGKRYSHTIDPVTGRPVTHHLASVSVLHRSAMTADALATALNVLGPEKGVTLANLGKIPALFIVYAEEGFELIYTNGFEDYFVEEAGK